MQYLIPFKKLMPLNWTQIGTDLVPLLTAPDPVTGKDLDYPCRLCDDEIQRFFDFEGDSIDLLISDKPIPGAVKFRFQRDGNYCPENVYYNEEDCDYDYVTLSSQTDRVLEDLFKLPDTGDLQFPYWVTVKATTEE